jgi:hypothetical protein
MKKAVYIIAVLFTLSVITGVVFAKTETEYDKAVRYYNTGKYREAVEIFKEYIKTNPDAPAYYRIGYALYELGAYDEANQYFQQAYLIDPSFSPDIVAPKVKARPSAPPPMEQARPVTEQQSPVITERDLKPATRAPAPVPGPKPQIQMEPGKPQEQVAAPSEQAPPGKPEAAPPGKEAPAPEGIVVPPQMAEPQPEFPEFPVPPEGMPADMPGLGTGLMAGLGMLMIVFYIVPILFYLLICYCIFRIAKKLDVPAPWLAFIPFVQVWTIVSCAGKPWWWIILLLIPVVGFIAGILIWMSITENLGRNKLLGLLMLLPLINLVIIIILAFSKSETYEGPVEVTTV